MTDTFRPALVLHGGAGVLAERMFDREIAHMAELARDGRQAMLDGASAVDAVVMTVRALEASGLYVAGKGSSPNRAGRYELDAAVMNGATREAGAVSALPGGAGEPAVGAARAADQDLEIAPQEHRKLHSR